MCQLLGHWHKLRLYLIVVFHKKVNLIFARFALWFWQNGCVASSAGAFQQLVLCLGLSILSNPKATLHFQL